MADLPSTSPSSPPGDDDLDPSPSPTCRLVVAHVGDRGSEIEPLIGDPVGPAFTAAPVLASDGRQLVVAGAGLDGVLRVWSGAPEALEVRARLPEGHHPVALTHLFGRWHLFGNGPSGHPCHATSTDLVSWTDDPDFVSEHPNVSVRGATAIESHVVVLAEVVVQGRAMGWTLLHGAEDPVSVGGFRAREITFPLTPAHRVVGPVHVRDDEIALAVTSSTTQLLARTVPGTRGRSWTLGLLAPPVIPSVVAARGREVWVAGDDPLGGAPLLTVTPGREVRLHRAGGPVCAAAFHGDSLVLARCSATADPDGRGITTIEAQSSPAYIPSISSA